MLAPTATDVTEHGRNDTTTSYIKFPSPGGAQMYAASTPSHFQIADVVTIFSPVVSTSEQPAYAAAVKRAID